MGKYEMSKQYKKDYLTTVIVRIDFLNSLESINKGIPKKLNDLIKNYFKILEPKKLIGKQLQFSKEEFKHSDKEVIEWKYFDKNRVKQFVLNPDFALIEYKKHEPYDNLKKTFLDISRSLFKLKDKLQIKRFGLRYINNVELQEKDLTNWQEYINNDLLHVLDFYENKKVLSRAISHLEFNFDDLYLRFQSGMRNPDYPAPISRKIFVLDYDCYSEMLIDDFMDLENKLEKSHDLIIQMFKSSITKRLEKILNEK